MEMWEISEAVTAGPGYELFPHHTMVKRRLSDPAQAGSQTHAQMLSYEDSAIRVAACFWRADQENEIGRERIGKAGSGLDGIDWADEKHDVSRMT